jgi:hypothetical protein
LSRGSAEGQDGSGSGQNSEAEVGDADAVDVSPGGLVEADDDGPGPLTLAASAARIEAEARIRAAMMQASSAATRDAMSDSHWAGSELADPEQAESELAESGDEDRPEIAVNWGGPAFSLRQVPDSGPQGAPSEDSDDAYEDDDDQDPPAGDRPARSLSSYVRRSRITRGYSIPRLSKSKRSGAVPGL